MALSASTGRGEISRGVIYPLPVFIERTGLNRKSIARLRRESGLIVRRAGRNSFVSGDDFYDAMARVKTV